MNTVLQNKLIKLLILKLILEMFIVKSLQLCVYKL